MALQLSARVPAVIVQPIARATGPVRHVRRQVEATYVHAAELKVDRAPVGYHITGGFPELGETLSSPSSIFFYCRRAQPGKEGEEEGEPQGMAWALLSTSRGRIPCVLACLLRSELKV